MHGEKPNGPMSNLQKIYYVTRSIEAICVVIATLLVAFNYSDVQLLLVLLILGIFFAIVSFSANERRERNPWLDYALYVQKKLRNIEFFKNQAERAVSPSYQQTMLKTYYRGVGWLIDDLRQLKIIALSRNEVDVAGELQNQIEELKEIHEKKHKSE
ncbi:MAG: hypothetical protein ACFFER_04780 [Candidatus Thorarchaeota archaeon]